MKRVLVVVLVWCALVVPMAALAPSASAQRTQPQVQFGQAVDSNSDGDFVVAAIDTDGQMFVGLWVDEFISYVQVGSGNWASIDVALTERGPDGVPGFALIALKKSGALWTTEFISDSSGDVVQGPWVHQGRATWSTLAVPSIELQGSLATFAAVKQNGRLYTRSQTEDLSWGGWQPHGLPTWAQTDIVAIDDETVVLVGTKLDGRLFTRMVGKNLGIWQGHGLPTWSPVARPSIATDGDRIVIAAVKEDNRAFVRSGTLSDQPGGPAAQWDPFDPPISTRAEMLSVARVEGRTVTALVNQDDELMQYTQRDGDELPTLNQLSRFNISHSRFMAPAISVADADSPAILLAVTNMNFLIVYNQDIASDGLVIDEDRFWEDGFGFRP